MNKIAKAIDNFKAGRIGLFPTDTAYGIGCRMDNIESVKRVYEIRKRPEEKALIVLVSSKEMAFEYVDVDKRAIKLIDEYWPGGLTIIAKCKKEKVPSIVRSSGDTLAARLPDHSILRQIIDGVGVPVVAPSANYSGGFTPTKFSDIDKSLLSKVDFVVDGVCTMEGVSTIVDTTKEPWQIVRQGNLKIKEEKDYDKTSY